MVCCLQGASTRKVLESELESAQRLLTETRAAEAALKQETAELKSRVRAQAQALQQAQSEGAQEGASFRKREMFALSAIVPFVCVLLLDMVTISFTFNTIRFLQATGLLAAALMLFRLRASRSARSASARASQPRSPRSPRTRSASGDDRMRAANASLSATEMEADCIDAVLERLRASDHVPPLLSDDDDLVHFQILRFVREHGVNVDAIEKRFRTALEWRESNLPPVPSRPDGGWMSASEMPNGEWATQFVAIALNAGYSKWGNPVKIERLGRFDVKRINQETKADPTARPRFNAFYLGLIEFLQRQLDTASVKEGRLSQTCATAPAHPLSGVASLRTARATLHAPPHPLTGMRSSI